MDNITCNICGETNFRKHEGFFYCNECGTQSQIVRDIEYEQDPNDEPMHHSKIKINQKANVEKNELSSWECFNYLLRGLVEELIELGAKDELKKVTLQLWAQYLKLSEVAFFSKNEIKLPKLGPTFMQRDVKIIYNHELLKRKRKIRKQNSGSGSVKVAKRKFMQKEYEKNLSSSSGTIYSSTSAFSSSSAATSNSSADSKSLAAIRLQFSSRAIKSFKKRMNISHLRKHELDSKNELNCHRLSIAKYVPHKDLQMRLTLRTIHTILYIALNLIEDNIQLSDFLRFLREGHLSSSNILHFFPEDVAISCENVIKSKTFCSKNEICEDMAIRRQTAFLCKKLSVRELKLPNLYELIERYIKDLNLPNDIKIWIFRLINICPKQKMPIKFEEGISPFYEARAMAFIIFTLKLLFGLDDHKEDLISESAKKINTEIENSSLQFYHKKLFIWSDWVKYIEMRKIILSQCHLPTAQRLNQTINEEQYLEQFKRDDDYNDRTSLTIKQKRVMHNLQNIFQSFLLRNQQSNKPNNDGISQFHTTLTQFKFSPSFTPNYSYFNEILKIQPKSENIFIPQFMKIDHSQFDIKSFLNTKSLKRLLQKNQIKLNIIRTPCKSEQNYIGILKHVNVRETKHFLDNCNQITFNIDENKWLEEVQRRGKKSDILEDSVMKADSKPLHLIKKKFEMSEKDIKKAIPKVDVNKMHENIDIQIFNEYDMNPKSENLFRLPRRNLDSENIFEGISDDDDESNDEDENIEEMFEKQIEMFVSNFDYWILFGCNKYLKEIQVLKIKNKLPKSYLWLLEVCASFLGIDWYYLFKEVMIVENFLVNVLESFENVTNVVKFKSVYNSKELEKIVNYYKNLW